MKPILLSLCLAIAATGATAQDVVRLGTEAGYPPYGFLNDAGEVDGLEREVGDELCRRAGFTCVWVTTDWDSIIPNLLSGSFDAIIAGMTINDERREVIDFTQDYVPATPAAYASLSTDADVETGVVAAQVSTVLSAHVAQTGATLLEFATFDEAVAAAVSGEADAVFGDRDALMVHVEASGGEMTFVGDPVAVGGGMGIGLRRSDPELRARFDAAIGSMKADGTLNAALTKWLGEETQLYE